jgi:hypothetical protein
VENMVGHMRIKILLLNYNFCCFRYNPAIDVEMSSVTVRGASANIEAFTHNVDKQNTTIKRRRIGYGFI